MNFKFDGDRLFFTSDTHFNHTNILQYCNRPFKTVDQMNETIIPNWNKMVGPYDVIFHIGDFCLGGSEEWNKIPYLCFEGGYHNDIWQLFGHVHTRPSNTGIDAGRLQYLFPTQLDVGVDNNNFMPLSLDEVCAKIQRQIEQDSKLMTNYERRTF